MHFKKSIIAGGSAVALAIAGTGGAAAEETELPPTGTVGSGAVYSAAPSDQAGALYGSFVPSEEEGADPTFQIAAAVAGLVAFGAAGKAVADTIAVPGKVYASVKDFQQFVDDFNEDSRNFINSITP